MVHKLLNYQEVSKFDLNFNVWKMPFRFPIISILLLLLATSYTDAQSSKWLDKKRKRITKNKIKSITCWRYKFIKGVRDDKSGYKYSYFTYEEDGKIIQEIWYSRDGSVRTVNTQAAVDDLKRKIESHKSDTTFKQDNKGNITSANIFDYRSKPVISFTYTYKKNLLKKVVGIDRHGTKEMEVDFTYSKDGLLTKKEQTFYEDDGEVDKTYVYHYDDQEREITLIGYNSKAGFFKNLVKKYGPNGNVIEWEETFHRSYQKHTLTYNKDRKILEEKSIEGTGSFEHYKNDYNPKGLKITNTYYNHFGEPIKENKYIYQYWD